MMFNLSFDSGFSYSFLFAFVFILALQECRQESVQGASKQPTAGKGTGKFACI